MWLRKLVDKNTYMECGSSIKRGAIFIWERIKHIRDISPFIKATILFIFYEILSETTTNFFKELASVLGKMDMAISGGNITLMVETINATATAGEFWSVVLKGILIFVFILIATWLFGDNKDDKKLEERINKMGEDIIQEIKKNRDK